MMPRLSIAYFILRNQEHASSKNIANGLLILRDDLHESDKGNVKGPVKAATDIRDVRDILRGLSMVRGLDAKSHQYFIEQINPVF